MKLRGALQVVCTTLLMWMSGMPVASSATRSIILLFDERPELPGLARLDAKIWRTHRQELRLACRVFPGGDGPDPVQL